MSATVEAYHVVPPRGDGVPAASSSLAIALADRRRRAACGNDALGKLRSHVEGSPDVNTEELGDLQRSATGLPAPAALVRNMRCAEHLYGEG
jgi:hypothetical protein